MAEEHTAEERPVVIVGAGPVGLSLALGLSAQGVPSVLLERDEDLSTRSKAPGIHVRTREVLSRWGVEESLLSVGVLRRRLPLHRAEPGGRPLLVADFDELSDEADRPGLLVLEQSRTERLLLAAVRGSGRCEVRFAAEAVGLDARPDGATVTFRERGATRTVEASFVVGCDGADSFVRAALGMPFEGLTYSVRPLLADVRVDDHRDGLPWPRVRNARGGITSALRLRPGLWRVIRLERGEPTAGATVSEGEVAQRVAECLGPGPVEVEWSSRFRIHRRAAPRFRQGRVLLAGDAAHVHSPTGGQGMNGGIQDAGDLAWKLAHARSGGDADQLLEAYDIERRAIAVERVSRYTDVLTRVFLETPVPARAAAFALARWGMAAPPIRHAALRRAAMLDLDHPTSPLLAADARSAGKRLPNPPLRAPDGAETRLHSLLPYGPAILDVADRRPFAEDLPTEHVVRIGPGAHADATGLVRGLLGGRDGLVLVRPDGHVAWARESLTGVGEAVRRALGLRRPHGP